MYSIYLYRLSYTFIYLQIRPNTFIYLHIPPNTPIYFKISNIRKIRINISPKKCLKLANLAKIGFRWVCQSLWGHGRNLCAKFCPLGMLWGPSYGHCYSTNVCFHRYLLASHMKLYGSIWRYIKYIQMY